MARPMANDPPFAALNHFTSDLGIPERVRLPEDWYYCPQRWSAHNQRPHAEYSVEQNTPIWQ